MKSGGLGWLGAALAALVGCGSPAAEAPRTQAALGARSGENVPEANVAADAGPQISEAQPDRPNSTASQSEPSTSSPEWLEFLENVQRVSFPRESARAAIADLDTGFLVGIDRGLALYAVGVSGASSERERLVAALEDSDVTVRAAALFALAELPKPDAELLLDQAREAAGTAFLPAAQLAMVLARSPQAHAQVESWLARGGPRAERLLGYRDWLANPLEVERGTVFDLYLRLRWESGQRYGLIDLQSWRGLQLKARLSDEAFLDLAVLGSVRGNANSPVGDHLVSLLFEQPSPGAIRAMARVLPFELNELIRFGLFDPDTVEHWSALLDELEISGPTPAVLGILDAALGFKPTRDRAAGLLLRLGSEAERDAGWEVLEPLLASSEPDDRLFCVERLAASGDPFWVEELGRLLGDPDPRVLAGALAAQVRLGDADAEIRAAELLAARDGPAFEPLVRALAEPRDRHPGLRLLGEMEGLEGELWVEVQLALAAQGDDVAREAVRGLLDQGTAGSYTKGCVQALAGSANTEDLARFAKLFPATDNLELDLAVMQALVAGQAPLGRAVLREALWQSDFDRGVLAGIVIVQLGGLAELYDELEVPPRNASPGDLRRLGYTLGLLDGVNQVERLARRRAVADPVLQGAYLGALASRTR